MSPFQTIFDAQKAYFASGVTRTYAWRIEQLDRMAGLLVENEAPLQRAMAADFKTGYKGIVYREPYGVTLIIGPFNGPLLLLIRPAISALAAGNTCVLKLSEQRRPTSQSVIWFPLIPTPRTKSSNNG
jgi:aldehyde dehydrogenase (NAD+)